MPGLRICRLGTVSAIFVATVIVARVHADNNTCATAISQDPPSCQGSWSPWFGANSGEEICNMAAKVYPEQCCASGNYITDWESSAGQANGITVGGVNITGVNFVEGMCSSGVTLQSAPSDPGSPKGRYGCDNGFNYVSGRDGLALDEFIASPESTGGGAWNWSCPQASKVAGYQAAVGYDVLVAIRFVCPNSS